MTKIHNETNTLATGSQVVRESSFGWISIDYPVALLATVEGSSVSFRLWSLFWYIHLSLYLTPT